MLTDIGFPAVEGQRSIHAEGSFNYGSRRGIWRLLKIFEEREIRVGVLAVVMGLVRNPEVAQAMAETGHEIVSHGWRWIDYQDVPEKVEAEHIRLAVEGIERVCGKRPVGWLTGRPGPNTRRLVVEEGGFLYDRDALDDEVPYWVEVAGKPHLVIPYSYETNDNRFNENSGFNTADDFFQYMRDAFDVLYAEGADEPKMLSLGIHDRLIGRPAKSLGLARFLDHVCCATTRCGSAPARRSPATGWRRTPTAPPRKCGSTTPSPVRGIPPKVGDRAGSWIACLSADGGGMGFQFRRRGVALDLAKQPGVIVEALEEVRVVRAEHRL